MDEIDGRILAELQDDGRLTVTELAQRVSLSVSRCHRRLRDLEGSGAIRGYHADVDPGALGFGFEAVVFVTMNQEDRDTLAAFEAGLAAIPTVVQAQRLFGDPDYLLRVVARDSADYQHTYDFDLSALPGVHRITSTIVMKDAVRRRRPPSR
ncbi:MAG: Lrp/AsnC family transcriptional regulator [Geodermatophilaceae bacterium]|nr:Lrp/AsnC family transcriptional regulator [Geodermatophilaceae bacterium]